MTAELDYINTQKKLYTDFENEKNLILKSGIEKK